MMRVSLWVFGAISILAGAAAVAACGADTGKDSYKGSGGSSNQGGSNGEGGSGDSAGTGGSIPIDATVLDVQAGDVSDEGCAAQYASGEVWPLDMYIIMDQSGSMLDTFGAFSTKTRWTAVTEGLTAFFTGQPANVDMGVGIGFFPLYKKPWSTFSQCPNGDECDSSHICVGTPAGDPYYCYATCASASDCPSGDECMLIDTTNNISMCTNDVCDVSAYASPEVAIASLATSKQPVLGAMASHAPINLTPTGVALEGALQYAQQYAAQHLDRKVIVVLATDGEPTDCPLDGQPGAGTTKAKQAAAAAAQASPSVKTFVIGTIMTGNMAATASCNQIAQAGGTGQPLFMKPAQPLADQFQAALDKIKGTAVGCEFKIPPADGGALDTGKVNVVYTVDGGSENTVYAVSSEADCDPTDGGWYYDDPANPTAIKLCPVSCAAVQQTGHKIEVSIQIGCKTQYMPPK